MATIPKTSVALLNAIAASPDSPRWNEFYDRYQPILAAWLQSGKFRGSIRPSDVDEIIQQTMIAFINGSSCMTVGGFQPHKFAWLLFYGLLSRSSGPRNFD